MTHKDKLTGCHTLTWANTRLLVHISISVRGPFMTAQLHLPIRSNQPLSQCCLTVCGVSSLCQWTVLLPHDYRCDLRHLSMPPSMRQLSTFLIQTIIAWFSNVLKCRHSKLCCNEYFLWSLQGEHDGRTAGEVSPLNWSIWLNTCNLLLTPPT